MMAQETPGESGLADMEHDIAEALARLPERQRRVFILKEIAGFEQAWKACPHCGAKLEEEK